MRQRWILHADMDAFYASIEQRENPELRGKPVIVGAGSARGVVAAASYEARQYGVRSAMPGFRARELCPNAVFVPGRMDLYAEVSAEVHEVFLQFTPQIQPLALDEAFLDVSGSLHLHGSPEALGAELKRRVKERTALDVSVGLAPNKLVAKVACTLSKPNGLAVVLPEQVQALLWPLPIRRLWGIGPTTAEKLTAQGFVSIGDLAQADPFVLRSVLGERAAQFQQWACGVDDSVVQTERVPKSCGEENTFQTDILDRVTVSAALTAHAEAVAARLRRAGLRGSTVTLKIKLGQRRGTLPSRSSGEDGPPLYPLLARSRSLAVATNDGHEIARVALALWDEAKIGVGVRLLGVSLSRLEPDSAPLQLDLFGKRQRSDRLGSALDAIQERFGRGAISRAVDTPEKVSPSLHRKL
jgi:DNA polymerase IV